MSSQEEINSRKSLKTLQKVASDDESLAGRPSKSLKHQLSQESSSEGEGNNPSESKETQAKFSRKVSAADLTCPYGASDTYWRILAEKRQLALQEALNENESLRKVIEDLKEEIRTINQMLEEASSFVEVIKEELNSANDDTGIDVNDVSTADETTDTVEDDAPSPTTGEQ